MRHLAEVFSPWMIHAGFIVLRERSSGSHLRHFLSMNDFFENDDYNKSQGRPLSSSKLYKRTLTVHSQKLTISFYPQVIRKARRGLMLTPSTADKPFVFRPFLAGVSVYPLFRISQSSYRRKSISVCCSAGREALRRCTYDANRGFCVAIDSRVVPDGFRFRCGKQPHPLLIDPVTSQSILLTPSSETLLQTCLPSICRYL